MSRGGLFVKLDVDFFSHPKVLAAGEEAAMLYLRMAAYCVQHLTDGFVPDTQVPRFGYARPSYRLRKLEQAGLIERHEAGEPAENLPRTSREPGENLARTGREPGENGWSLPGFLDRYLSAAEVAELREKRRSAGRKGGRPKKDEPELSTTNLVTQCRTQITDHRLQITDMVKSSVTEHAQPPAPDDDDLPAKLLHTAGITRPGPSASDRKSVDRALARGWTPDALLAKAARAADAGDPSAYLRAVLSEVVNSDPPRTPATPTAGGETREQAWAAVARHAAAGVRNWGAVDELSPRARRAARDARQAIRYQSANEAKWAFFDAWAAAPAEHEATA